VCKLPVVLLQEVKGARLCPDRCSGATVGKGGEIVRLIDRPLATLRLDEHGFLVNPEEWDEAVARELARIEGIPELSEEHWRVLYYVRQHVAMFGSPPWVKDICRVTGMSLVTLSELFPQRPVQTACKVAGVRWFPELGYLGCGADPA